MEAGVYYAAGLLILGGLFMYSLLRKPRVDLATAVEQLVALADETLPSATGQEKLAFVLDKIKQMQTAGTLGREDPLLLRAMIEAAVTAGQMARAEDKR